MWLEQIIQTLGKLPEKHQCEEMKKLEKERKKQFFFFFFLRIRTRKSSYIKTQKKKEREITKNPSLQEELYPREWPQAKPAAHCRIQNVWQENGQLSYQERSNRCEERTKNKERSTEPATGGKKGVNVKEKKRRRNEKAHKALDPTGSI